MRTVQGSGQSSTACTFYVHRDTVHGDDVAEVASRWFPEEALRPLEEELVLEEPLEVI